MKSNPECTSSLITPFSTPSSGPATDSTLPQDDLRTLVSWERKWLMSFNIEKCHQLTVTKKRNRIPISYTLHKQILERVTHPKYLEVDLTENLWGEGGRRGGTHSVICSKSQQSEYLHIQKPEGMPNCCTDTLLLV